MFRKTILPLAALALTAGPAIAQTEEMVRNTVTTADLDLSTPAGAATLDRRIGAVIERMCSVRGVRGLHVRVDAEKCRRTARASVETQVADAIAQARSRLRVASIQRGNASAAR